jgi:hypothetical protein
LETIADSATAKFVTPLYRKVKLLEEVAINKVLSNPLHYGVRFVCSTDTLQDNVDGFTNAIRAQVDKGVDKILSSFNQAVKMGSNGSPEASVKSMLSKGLKGLKKITKEEFEDIVKPALHTLAQDVKGLPKNVANRAITAAIDAALGAPVANSNSTVYNAPRVRYPLMNQSKINTQAASGWVGPSFKAMTKDIKKVSIEEKESFCVPLESTTLFPAIYLDEKDEFVEQHIGGTQTVASLFAIVDAALVALPWSTTYTRVANYHIYNYAVNKLEPVVTPINPGKNVALMRVTKINESARVLWCEIPEKPVTGRSLDLAMWAYSRGFCNGMVFSGQVDAGKVLPMPLSTAAAKVKFVCEENHMALCTNAPYIQNHMVIQVTDLLGVAPMLMKLLRPYPALSDNYWLASQDEEMKKHMIDLTGASDSFKREFFGVTQLPQQTALMFDPDTYTVHALNWPDYIEAPFPSASVMHSTPFGVNWVARLRIGEMHKLMCAYLRDVDTLFPCDYSQTSIDFLGIPCAATAAVSLASPKVFHDYILAVLNDPESMTIVKNPQASPDDLAKAMFKPILSNIGTPVVKKDKPVRRKSPEGGVTIKDKSKKVAAAMNNLSSRFRSATKDAKLLNELKMFDLARKQTIVLPQDICNDLANFKIPYPIVQDGEEVEADLNIFEAYEYLCKKLELQPRTKKR